MVSMYVLHLAVAIPRLDNMMLIWIRCSAFYLIAMVRVLHSTEPPYVFQVHGQAVRHVNVD